MRAAISAFLCFLVALGLFGWSGYELITSTTGEQAKAVVERCDTTRTGRRNRTRTTCYGAWQQAGVVTRGKVNGTGRDDVGTVVDVRLHGGEAHAFSWIGILVPAGVGTFMLGGSFIWILVAVYQRSRRQPQRQYARAY